MFGKLISSLGLIFIVVSTCSAQDEVATFEKEIPASVDEVWNAFSTTEGLRRWFDMPDAKVELKIGGKQSLGGIEQTILCYDPKKMIAVQVNKVPVEGNPLFEAAKEVWIIYYFEEIAETKTKVRVVGHGYSDSKPSQLLRLQFKTTREYELEELAKSLEAKSR